ncbi:peptidase M42 [Sulfurimonas sp.]|uniref:peptidase M42 n=1 Tax=Sulfurimonas sp. TaxID=2022749 RepID=UPI00261EB8FA|nr:peptidase M42 [Sulfurimonas sp.]MDD5156516.1 peptidase M42 [Sulfurimonas sp.]
MDKKDYMQKNYQDFIDILKHLIRKPSVVGAEHPFFLSIKRELDELGIKTTLYEGLLVAEGSEPERGMISAHIDRHGLICTGPNEFQYAAFLAQNRGDLTGDSFSEQTFMNIAERFKNQVVQAYEPWSGSYLGLGIIDNAYICERRKNLVFEVKGLEHLIAGTPVAFVDTLKHEDGLFSAQLDNVVSAAIILYMYQKGYKGLAFFTAQEESGKSWRFLLEHFRRWGITSDRLLVLDTSPYPDRQKAQMQDVVLRHGDASAEFNSPLTGEIERLCKKYKIMYSFKDSYIREKNKKLQEQGLNPVSLGRTELGRLIVASGAEIQGTTLQIPTTGYHTTSETVLDKSLFSILNLLLEMYIGKKR